MIKKTLSPYKGWLGFEEKKNIYMAIKFTVIYPQNTNRKLQNKRGERYFIALQKWNFCTVKSIRVKKAQFFSVQ